MLTALLALAPVQFSYQFPDIDRAEFEGHVPGDAYGANVANVGDLNGDGIDDYAVGRPGASGGFFNDPEVGEVVLRSGTDGSVLDVLVGPVANSRLGAEGIAGGFDHDLDGKPEIAITAPGQLFAKVYVYEIDLNGSDPIVGEISQLVSPFSSDGRFGEVIVNVGDQNGDGRNDLAVGIPTSSGQFTLGNFGRIRIYSGATWTELETIQDTTSDTRFGTSLVNVGDVNLDGVPDIAIGAPGPDDGTHGEPGRAYVYSAQGLFGPTLLTTMVGNQNDDLFGSSLQAVGDLDGGGAPELLIGSPGYAATDGSGATGRVEMRRTTTGSAIWSQSANADNGWQARSTAAGDFDRDGGIDVATFVRRAPTNEGGGVTELTILDGLTGAEIRSFDAWAASPEVFDGESVARSSIAAVRPSSVEPHQMLVGFPDLEFDSGGLVAYELDFLPIAPGPSSVTVDPIPGNGDFTAISHASLLAGNGQRIEVRDGVYDGFEIVDSVDLFGPTSFFQSAQTGDVSVVGVDEITLWRLNTGAVTVDDVTTPHLVRLNAPSVLIADCDNATLAQSSIGQTPGEAAPAIDVRHSFLQIRSVSAVGQEFPAPGLHPALQVTNSDVLAADSSFRGGNVGSDPNPAIFAVGGSTLDLRGGDDDVVDSEDFLGTTEDLLIDPTSKARVGASIPPFVATAFADVTLLDTVSPWIEFNATAPVGATLSVLAHDDPGDVLILAVGFLPTLQSQPLVVDTPLLVDLSLTLPLSVLISSGPSAPTTQSFGIPPDPGLLGLELELQAFAPRPDGLFDGTNGGRVLIR